MNLKKKSIIIISCAAVAVGGIFGGYKVNEVRKKNKSVVNVVPVRNMMNNFWGDEIQLEGMVCSGNAQRITQDESMLIEKILVKKGDPVKKGTPIVKYDATLIKLEVKQKKNALAVAEDRIKQTEKEISRLQGLKSSEDIPPMPEPEKPTEPEMPDIQTVDLINTGTAAVSGSGAAGSPFSFNCTPDTVVEAQYLNSLIQTQLSAEFNVYENNTLIYTWSVDGAQLSPESINGDWTVGANVQADGTGNVRIDYSEACFGSFESYAPGGSDEPDFSDYESSREDYMQGFINNGSDDYLYSEAQIKKMIAAKQKELKELETELKLADVAYRQASAKNTDGMAVSGIDGVVTYVNDGSDPDNTDSALMIIQGGNKAIIESYIGELNLDKISVGSTVNVTSYSSGMCCEAKVTSIDTTPVTDHYSWNDNPNSSTYSFKAEITGDAEDFNVGEYVSVSISQTETGNTFYIPMHYTREDSGRYYVMKAGEDGRLEKQYIKTGKIIYGSEIEIKGGLGKKDKICFPYGKNVKEGVKTKETDEVQW